MKIDAKIRAKVEDMLKGAGPLYMSAPSFPSLDSLREAWVVTALQLIDLLAPNPLSPYRSRARHAMSNYLGMADNRVDMLSAILAALVDDIDAGIAPGIGEGMRVEVFGEFLSHAEGYLLAKRIGAAGVVAGVVFEDTIRRACDRHKIPERGIDLDQLISALRGAGTFRM